MRVVARNSKGQTTLEYAILMIVIIGALLTIQSYIKRGIQGKVKSSADDIGEQFDPGNTNYFKSTNSSSSTSQVFKNGQSISSLRADDFTNTYVSQNIDDTANTYWGQ